MSVKRRLAAAGMPAVGVTVFAALALTGQPASAALVDGSVLAQRVAVAPAAATCDPDSRVKCGYGDTDDGSAGGASASPTATSGSSDGVSDDDRGGDGYGETPTAPPTATPVTTTTAPAPATTTPGGGTDEVPGGEAPARFSPSDEDILPVTGPPVGLITTMGVLLTAAGAAILVGLRRRRNA